MLAFDTPLPIDRDVLGGNDVIAWAARNNAKPERRSAEAWTLHATAQWSRAHLEHQPEDVAALLSGRRERRPADIADHLDDPGTLDIAKGQHLA